MLSDVNEPLNLGNPKVITILDLTRKIIEATDSNSSMISKPLPENDQKFRQPDITKAKDLLHWEP